MRYIYCLPRRPALVSGLVATAFLALAVTDSAAQKPKSQMSRTDAATAIKPTLAAKKYPACSRDHPKRARRAESLAKQGDSRMGLSAARHAVRYAIERYGIKDLVSDTSLARADKDVYEFLKWKSGSASLLAGQWLTAGYQHYDSHADEAAASLLGYNLPGPQDHIQLPKTLTAWIKEQTDSASKETNDAICSGLYPDAGNAGGAVNSTTPGSAGSTVPSDDGSGSTIAGLACEVVVELARQATKRMYDRLGIEGGMFRTKKWDFRDAEIPVLIELRRNPPAPAASAATAGGKEEQLPASVRVQVRAPTRR